MSTRYKCLIPLIGLLIAGCGDDSGKKQSECPGGGTMCPDGQCYNLSFDNDHCGRCDNVCSETESCQAGVCDPIPIEARCIAPKLVCGDVCVDPRGDREHCGDCTKRCEDDELCKNSSCVKSCEAPETACSDGCHDLNSDTKNCKTCGHDCNAGLAEGETPYVCVNGDCVNDCPNGELICGGNCTNPKTSKNYCGASDDCKDANAGKVCAAGAECNDGTCSCTNSGESVCKIGGELKCANAKSSETCGCDENGAGLNCSALPNIESGECGTDGACSLVCRQNYDNCNGDAADGCETDLTTIENCGSCGNACDAANTTGAVCENGSCKYTCGEGAVLCDGSCADLSKDNDNCGWCGNKCTGKSTCQGGFCVIDSSECKDGYVEGISVVGYDGTEKTVKAYCIQDYDELVKLRDHVKSSLNFHDGKFSPYPSAEGNPDNAYILMGNINMGSNTTWTPIGPGPTFKEAIFLGNGKRIYGTLINSGLFGVIEYSVIQDLNLELNINYNAQASSLYHPGALADTLDTNAVLRRIREKGTIECSTSPCGGLVGIVSGYCSTTLSQIDMEGTIYANGSLSNVGGVIGVGAIKQIDRVNSNVTIIDRQYSQYVRGLLAAYLYDAEQCADSTEPAVISDCHVKGSIKFSDDLTPGNESTRSAVEGGLIGQLRLSFSNLDIKNSSADVQIDMQAHSSGGLIAQIDTEDNARLTISDCEASGSIDCWSSCGGLIGVMNAKSNDVEKDPTPITVTNSHAKVDIKSESEFDQMDNFGGFVGSVSHGIIKDSTAAGKIETIESERVGGFAGNAEFTTLSNVSFEGSVAGQNYVGGIGGYMTSKCIVENAIAKGTVKSGHTAGGLIGYAFDADRIENGVTFADVEGQMQCGSFIGQYRGGTLSNCAATGKTVCLGEGGVGGFFGNVSGLTTLKQIVSLSDITSETYSGGLAGSASDGPLTFENIFINGNVASNNGASGAIFGMAYIVSIDTLNNVYYWKSAEDMNLIGVGTGGIDLTGVKSFTYNSEKKPVLEDGTSLIEELKDTGKWLEGACKLTTGPGLANPGVYYIPVLKSLGMDICGND